MQLINRISNNEHLQCISVLLAKFSADVNEDGKF